MENVLPICFANCLFVIIVVVLFLADAKVLTSCRYVAGAARTLLIKMVSHVLETDQSSVIDVTLTGILTVLQAH